jgi:hypothetical protein
MKPSDCGHVSAREYVSVFIVLFVWRECMFVCVYVCIYVRCVCMYVCMYMYCV